MLSSLRALILSSSIIHGLSVSVCMLVRVCFRPRISNAPTRFVFSFVLSALLLGRSLIRSFVCSPFEMCWPSFPASWAMGTHRGKSARVAHGDEDTEGQTQRVGVGECRGRHTQQRLAESGEESLGQRSLLLEGEL